MTGNAVYESLFERAPDFGVSLKNVGNFVKKKQVFSKNKGFSQK